MRLSLFLPIVLSLSCTVSEYRPGSQSLDTTPNPPPVVTPPPTNDTDDDDDGEEEEIKFDLTFDTHLKRCIKDKMDADFGGYVSPRVLDRKVTDFADGPLETYEDFRHLPTLS